VLSGDVDEKVDVGGAEIAREPEGLEPVEPTLAPAAAAASAIAPITSSPILRRRLTRRLLS
jgi:hypothetical protein